MFTETGDTLTWDTDGKEISPQDLKGKSGHLQIKFDYTNHEKKTVSIDGKSEKVFSPFVMLTGLILPTETFSNVMIDNEKVISDGNRNIVLGFTTPGLKESLGINEYTSITLPESLEISADVTDFSMYSTFTVGLSDLFEQLNFKDISDMDSLKSSLDELEDAAMQLVDGSSQLSEGADTLGSNYKEFDADIQTLKTGIDTLQEGTCTLSDGINSYTTGADQLNNGIQTYLGSNGVLTGKVTEYVNGVNTLVLGTKSYTEGTDQLCDGITSYIKGEQQLSEGGAQLSELGDGLTQVKSSITQFKALNPLSLSCLQNFRRSKNMGLLDKSTDSLPAAVNGINTLLGGFKQLDGYNQTLLDGASKLKANSPSLVAGINTLAGGTDELASGLNTLGTQLSDGSGALAANSAALRDGASTLLSGTTELSKGGTTLQNESKQVKDGMQEFDEQGTRKLKDTVEKELGNILDRLEVLTSDQCSYDTFSGKAKDMEGNVKFVIETDAIE